MKHTVSRLGRVSLETFEISPFVKPQSVYYELDGKRRRWDVIDSHDSVAVVIYHADLKCMLMVRQFRPALYASHMRYAAAAGEDVASIPLARGFTCELCAGIVDKDKSLVEIAQEEIFEECGYRVPASAIFKLTSFAASVGVQGARQTLFFAQVDSSMEVTGGGGVAADGECIELLALPLDGVDGFIMDESVPKTSGAMFGLSWGKLHVQKTLHLTPAGTGH